ncbi:beta-amylase 4 [Prunus dulcis]|uniref:Beta-amylase n=1 Tax=Prunus dulcis TaxID=3755 RepID=A0A4Y1RDE1_PRUDU|nr:beta-amylase 4 [Prunus dulcis]
MGEEVTFDEKPNLRNHLRNVSTVPLFRNGLITRCPSVAGNSILSMDARENSRSTILPSSRHQRVPIYVMMPVDAFCIDGSGRPKIRKIKALTVALKALKLAGVHGIAVEVWWGIVERSSPLAYDWSLYEELFKLVSKSELKLHVALSFHSNMYSSSSKKGGVSLPLWIIEIGDHNKHIYYHDQNGLSNDDYLTLGVDHVPLFCGRTAVQCYEDFMLSFVKKFESFIGGVIEEISVGLGPSGELRYPAHPFGDGRWNFPGIGEFQCYDKYMMDDLRMAACKEGKPQWGDRDHRMLAVTTVSHLEFLSLKRERKAFFLIMGEWYSGRLLHHADDILAKAAKILRKYQENKKTSILLVAKIGGIFWWYQTAAHPAELTAGYYNTALRDGYEPVASILSRHGAALHFSCLEMMDTDNPASYLCSPEGLRQQIWTASKKRIIHLIGRNTNERFDRLKMNLGLGYGKYMLTVTIHRPKLILVNKMYGKHHEHGVFKNSIRSNEPIQSNSIELDL